MSTTLRATPNKLCAILTNYHVCVAIGCLYILRIVLLSCVVRGLNQIIVQIVPQAPFLDQGRYSHLLPIYRGSQDGLPLWRPYWTNPRWPPSGVGHFNNFRIKSVLNINDSTFVGLSSMGNPFLMLFSSFEVHVMCQSSN